MRACMKKALDGYVDRRVPVDLPYFRDYIGHTQYSVIAFSKITIGKIMSGLRRPQHVTLRSMMLIIIGTQADIITSCKRIHCSAEMST